MWDTRNAQRLLVGEPEGKRQLDIPGYTWVDNTCIKMDLQDTGWEGIDWISLAQDM
jgi:hypothetical protein